MTQKQSQSAEKHFPIKEWWDIEYHPKDIPRKEYNEGDVVLVIDGDIAAYKSSSATERKYIIVTNKNGKTKEFDTRTKFKDWCKSKGKNFGDYIIEDGKEVQPLSFCLETAKRFVNNVMKTVGATHYEIYVEGKGNFRKDLPLIDRYKERDHSVRPRWLSETKEYYQRVMGAIRVSGRETDDFVQQRLFELYNQGVKAVVLSNDKDVKQNITYDITVYNPDDKSVTDYEGGVGALWETSAGIKGSGVKWLMFQTTLYDKIDNYCLNQFYKKQYGEKSFYKDFKDLKTIEEVLTKTVENLKTKLPEVIEYTAWDGSHQKHNWLSLTELYFSCAYMRIKDNDSATFESLLKEYGIEY